MTNIRNRTHNTTTQPERSALALKKERILVYRTRTGIQAGSGVKPTSIKTHNG